MAGGRRECWSCCGVLVVVIGLPAGETHAGSRTATPASSATVRGNLDVQTRFLLGQALSGASARLGQPKCQAVFSDFSDPSGRSLDRVLEESGYTGQAYLALVFFADGAGHKLCETGLVGAFTVPSSRVVRVCPLALRRLSREDPRVVEAILIHELLHSLGLRENPPTTEEISERVERRCLVSR